MEVSALTAGPESASGEMRDTATAVVRRLFAAYNARDVDAIMACWAPGGIENMPMVGSLSAPEGLRRHFEEFYSAFPDSTAEVLKIVADTDGQVAAQIRLSGTFTGGPFAGLRANGHAWRIDISEFIVTENGLITRLDVYMDTMELARQIRLFPQQGGMLEKTMYAMFNGMIAMRRSLAPKRPK